MRPRTTTATPKNSTCNATIMTALIGATFILAGCGSEAGLITSPLASSGYSGYILGEGSGGGSSQPDDVVPGNEGTGVGVTTTITVAGGGQIISGRHTLTLPSGAVKNDVAVTVVDLTDELGYPAARILPEGLQFHKKGSLVTYVADMLDSTSSQMYRVINNGQNGDIWSPLNATVTPDGSRLSATPPKAGLYAVNTVH